MITPAVPYGFRGNKIRFIISCCLPGANDAPAAWLAPRPNCRPNKGPTDEGSASVYEPHPFTKRIRLRLRWRHLTCRGRFQRPGSELPIEGNRAFNSQHGGGRLSDPKALVQGRFFLPSGRTGPQRPDAADGHKVRKPSGCGSLYLKWCFLEGRPVALPGVPGRMGPEFRVEAVPPRNFVIGPGVPVNRSSRLHSIR